MIYITTLFNKKDRESPCLFFMSGPVSRILSWTAINLDLPLPAGSSHLLRTAGPALSSPTVLLRIEFTAVTCLHAPGELLPHLSTISSLKSLYLGFPCGHPQARISLVDLPHDPLALGSCGDPKLTRKSISVALVRGSPLAGVTRYPCPVEPGLSSRTGFRLMPATIRRTCRIILHTFA